MLAAEAAVKTGAREAERLAKQVGLAIVWAELAVPLNPLLYPPPPVTSTLMYTLMPYPCCCATPGHWIQDRI